MTGEGEEGRMAAREDLTDETAELDNEINLDSDADEDIEEAMREALEAVEKASRSGSRRGDAPISSEIAADESTDVAEPGIIELEQELADLRDRSVRTLADFDNYRKRVERERADDRRYAAFDLARDFLSVIDNLNRAVGSEGSVEDLKTGVEMILRQVEDVLTTFGVRKVEALGREFDPRYHEAISRHEDLAIEVPTVSEELQSGYLMHDRLLRPAIVKVAVPPARSSEASQQEAGEA